jgi:hypothetical protein
MDKQGAFSPEHQRIADRLDEILDEIKKINSAFPHDEEGGADHIGHRRYHEKLMKAADAEEKFWRELKLDLTKKGLWGLLVIVCGLILVGLTTKLGIQAHIGPP